MFELSLYAITAAEENFSFKNMDVFFKNDTRLTIYNLLLQLTMNSQETRIANNLKTCQHNYQRTVLSHNKQFKVYVDKCDKCEKIKQYPEKEMKILSQLFSR